MAWGKRALEEDYVRSSRTQKEHSTWCQQPELRKPEVPALLFSTCEAINSCFLIFKIEIFFPVSFYFYFNLTYLVEYDNMCDTERSDTETKYHFYNYYLIIQSIIKVTQWVSQICVK